MRRSWGAVVVLGALASIACGGSGSGGEPSGLSQGSSDFAAICASIVSLPCSEYSDTAKCESEGAAGREEAVKAGCGAEFDAYVSCLSANPMTCAPDGDLTVSQACYGVLSAFAKCDQGTG